MDLAMSVPSGPSSLNGLQTSNALRSRYRAHLKATVVGLDVSKMKDYQALSGYSLEVTVSKATPPGAFDEFVLITFSDPEAVPVRLRITGNVTRRKGA